MKRNLEKGITLIALVVTIIVLIILAGVSIALIFNQNGIIQKSKQAKQDTIVAKEKEINAIEKYGEEIDIMTENKKIDASKILFTPKDKNWNVKNVKEALDYLYNM